MDRFWFTNFGRPFIFLAGRPKLPLLLIRVLGAAGEEIEGHGVLSTAGESCMQKPVEMINRRLFDPSNRHFDRPVTLQTWSRSVSAAVSADREFLF